MLNISYAISSRLRDYLAKIENLRKEVHLIPISPKTELKLRWEANFNRIYGTLKLSGNNLTKSQMLYLLSHVKAKNLNTSEKEVLDYKKALDEISQDWPGENKALTAKDLIDLHRMFGSGRLRVPSSGLQYLLDYLQAKFENPIIQAAIINIEMEKMQLFSESNKLIANLASLIFLYKYGYDFRGFLSYESEWLANDFKEVHDRALSSTNLTLWLEYFALCILREAERMNQSLAKPKTRVLDLRESFWKLNERQKSILNFLDSPESSITNRQIQKRFKTSQITTSRDLARLTNLGFLFSHGKGRSVYYTKIRS